MTIVTSTQQRSIASQLSSKELTEGSRIIRSLPSFESMNSRSHPLSEIVKAIYSNEFEHEEFSQYMRKFAGYEVSDQKAFLAELLMPLCKNKS